LLTEQYAKQHGFLHEFFPERSPIISDQALLKLISKSNVLLTEPKQHRSAVLGLLGDPGLGKTTLAHHLSYYFDFGDTAFTAEDIRSMLSSTLEGSQVRNDPEFDRELDRNSCFFVFDNFLSHPPASSSERSERQGVLDFIQGLHAKGHVCLLTGTGIADYGLALDVLTLEPISSTEAGLLCTSLDQKVNAHDRASLANFEKIIRSAKGNPWLLEKLANLLGQIGADQLSEEMSSSSYANTVKPDKAVNTFYEWRWSTLNRVSKDLLLMCEQTPGLVLEMIFSFFERTDGGNTYAANLLTSLGHDAKISSDRLFAPWRASSFVRLTNVGTKIEPSARIFLRTLAQRESFSPSSDSLNCFSLIICEAIRTLSGALINKPNPLMTNYLLLSRRSWIQHFERLWFSEYYSEFFGVKAVFKKVMHGSELAAEVDEWAKDLLGRTTPIYITKLQLSSNLSKACSAWLQLASDLIERGYIRSSGHQVHTMTLKISTTTLS